MSENEKITPEQSKPPEMIPPPPPVESVEKSGYKMARQDIQTPKDVELMENFIGTVYGDAKRIDKTNVSNSQFTKGLKFDAEKEILNVRNIARGNVQPQQIPQPQNVQSPQAIQPPPQVMHTQVSQIPQNIPPVGDSLILKHEIDQIKEQVKEIKKLYDEFFKLKTVKGKWLIETSDKTHTTTTVAKTWNIINKLLKSKTTQINIKYIEDE